MKNGCTKARGLREAQEEWRRFEQAIKVAQPALETFSNEGLMFLHLLIGDKALREQPKWITNPQANP